MPSFVAPSPFRMQPALDQLAPDRRIAPDAPLVAAYIGGRPVVLARPDMRNQPGSQQETIPITISRLRRAGDIDADRATGPYVPSMVDDFPLSVPTVFGTAGIHPLSLPAPAWKLALGLAFAGLVIWGAKRILAS